MRTMDVDGLPEPVVQALEKVVQVLRGQLVTEPNETPPVQLPFWPGIAVPPEQLRREEIYRNVG